MRKFNYLALMILLVSFQLIGFAATPVHVTLSNGAKCKLSGNVYMVVSGNLNNSGEFIGTETSTAKFTNTTGQQLIGGTGTTQFQKAEFDNPSNFKLQGNVSADGSVTLTSGTVDIDNFNLTMGTDANFQGTFGTTKMVIADKTGGKTGQVMKIYKSGATNFLYPIGDATATIDYSPLALNFTANSAPRTIGVNVVDGKHPNDLSANFISRYWNFTDDACSGTYTYDATYSYSANSPTDLVGTYNTVDIFWWNGSWNLLPTARPSAPNYSVSGANETTGTLCGNQFTGRTCPLPGIVSSPQNQSVCQYAAVTFTVDATGTEMSYQWKKGSKNITGATTSKYTISKALPVDYDTYTCRVSNACGYLDIPTFTLTVNTAPVSNIKYTKQIKELDDNVTYTLNPSGTTPFTFKWIKDGVEIPGQTNSTFNISSVSCDDKGLYTCEITNVCNTITPKIVELFVNGCVRFKFTISGYVKYENKDSFGMSSRTNNTVTNVSLFTTADSLIEKVETDDNGFYVFADVVNGDYKLIGSTSKTWGGSNPADALLVNRHYIGVKLITDALKKLAADVNSDTKIDPKDALVINRRYIGVITSFVNKDKVTVPDWIFSNPLVTVLSIDVIDKNIKAICTGDVNGSYSNIPPKNMYTSVNNAGMLNINIGKQFDLPVYINDINELGALGLKLKNQDLNLKIIGLNSEEKGIIYNITNDGINIAWSADNQGLNISPDKPVFVLKAVYNGHQNPEGLQLLSNESIIVDNNDNAINNDNLIMPKLVLNNSTSSDFNLYNHPNPFNNVTNIDYVIPEDLNVKINIYNVLGEKISTITDQRQSAGKYTVQFDGSILTQGVYYCRIEATNSSSTYTKTNILMIAR